MSAYRKNSWEAKMEADKEKFFTRYRRQTLRYTFMIATLTIPFALAIGFSHYLDAYHPAKTCKDHSEIVTPHNNDSFSCDDGQRMDTTRIREGDSTYVLVRCWCGDHNQKDETP